MSTIAIAAVGSRGDVVPLTGLGAALRRAGHRVVIAAYTPFSELVSRSDCEFRDMPSDFNPGAEDSDIRTKDVVAAMFGPSGQRDTGQLILDALADVPADLLLIPPLAELAGHPLAEARGIPSVVFVCSHSPQPSTTLPACSVTGPPAGSVTELPELPARGSSIDCTAVSSRTSATSSGSPPCPRGCSVADALRPNGPFCTAIRPLSLHVRPTGDQVCT